jgi:hypothetical protein
MLTNNSFFLPEFSDSLFFLKSREWKISKMKIWIKSIFLKSKEIGNVSIEK